MNFLVKLLGPGWGWNLVTFTELFLLEIYFVQQKEIKQLPWWVRVFLRKMRAFSLWNARIFTGNARIFRKMCAEIAKSKFSDIGLASSKGLFFERPSKVNFTDANQGHLPNWLLRYSFHNVQMANSIQRKLNGNWVTRGLLLD